MNVTNIKEDYVGTWVVDVDTGEVVSFVPDTKKKPRVAPFDKIIGVDTKYPSDCLTKDSLLNALSVIDPYVFDGKSKVDSEFLLLSLTEGHITKSEATLLTKLAKNLSGWNYCITTIQELIEQTGIDKFTISKTLKNLTPNLLVVTHKDKPNKGCVVLKINPIIAWRGDLSYREPAIQSWYTNNNISKSK